MSNGESQKVVQIPEDTFRKMREKLKKQDERIKTLENQLTTIEQDRGGGGGGIDPAILTQKEEELEQLRAKIKEVEAVIDDQKNQIERLSLTNAGGAETAATGKELEEKEELIKFLMEREKQLLAALENQPQAQTGGAGSQHLVKGLQLLKKLETEMKKREEILTAIFSKMEKMKETMSALEQDLVAIPTQEDVDNEVKEAMKQAEGAAVEEGASEGAASYEVILDRIKNQLGKSSELKTKLSHEQETIVLQRKGISQRFEFLNGNIEGLNSTIKDKEGRLNSAREFFEAKYTEWKAQDEARAREMENLWGMIGAE